MNYKEGEAVGLVLQEMGHTQPLTPVHLITSAAVDIATRYGNEIFLGHRPSEVHAIPCLMAPMTGKVGRLLYQTF